MESATHWVNYLNLTPHPEGGYFKEIYRCSLETDLEGTLPEKRNLATSIYYMLEHGQVSKLHRLQSDEIWYFHYGAALKIHIFDKNQYYAQELGVNLSNNQSLQLIIPAGVIFGAEVVEPNTYSIVGCMVSPGFHFRDFELINAEDILPLFPLQKSVIEKLT